MSQKNVVKKDQELSYAGMDQQDGFDHLDKEEIRLPYIVLLQPLSPAVARDELGKAGQFMNTLTNELFEGDQGVVCIPVDYQKRWVLRGHAEHPNEDEKNRFIAAYSQEDPLVQEILAKCEKGELDRYGKKEIPNPDDPKWPYQLVETYYQSGLLCEGDSSRDLTIVGPFVMAFKSTKITPLMAWRNQAFQYRHREPSGQAIRLKTYCHAVRITSYKYNGKTHTWWKLKVDPLNGSIRNSLVPMQSEGYMAGEALYKSLHSGDKIIDFAGDQQDQTEPEGEGGKTSQAEVDEYAKRF